jgi:hypothetical protein
MKMNEDRGDLFLLSAFVKIKPIPFPGIPISDISNLFYTQAP